jgi:hypothetical protein
VAISGSPLFAPDLLKITASATGAQQSQPEPDAMCATILSLNANDEIRGSTVGRDPANLDKNYVKIVWCILHPA